ncbi:calcium-binding protein [Synechococcus sp. UW140]|uniref:calcium-binding protein n=1 Tax=Synechococcus sp. UW140 TaxID=368503 RepID=UPI003137DD86
MVGGAGDDTYLVDDTSDVVTEAFGAGTDTVQSSISYALTANVENLVLTGTDNINGIGNDLANNITGNAGNNTIDGGTGADSLAGGVGDDIYVVDNAADAITEAFGAGTDTVQSSINYTLASNIENLVLKGTRDVNGTGNALNNLLTGNSGKNILSGGAGDDTYLVNNTSDIVSEEASGGTDTVQSPLTHTLATNVENLILTGTGNINGAGNDLANTITGNAGNNTIDGGTGEDNLVGGAGDDTYLVNSISDVVLEAASEGTDTVQSSISYTLAANVENLLLTGTSNINGTGNALNNLLTGNSAANILSGDVGDDTYVVDNAGDVVTEASGGGTDTVQAFISYALTANVENLLLTGTSNINGTGNDLANIITGNEGNNTIDGAAGADNLAGGAGDDTYLVDNTSDVVSEEASEGTDTVQSSVTYTLATNIENLLLTGTDSINGTGNDLANTITGNAGKNIIDGGAGADKMAGVAGNDIYVVDNSGDVVTEAASEGIDTVQSSIAFALTANVENLVLIGAGNINGTGNELANTITGNAGNNTIDGGTGADNMSGNAGNDIYVVDNASDVVTEAFGAGTDTVQSSISYALTANAENLTLTGTDSINGTGNALNNFLTGNSAANILSGGAGADTMTGGAGDDTYLVDNKSDVASEEGSEGDDTVQSSVSYTLTTNVENLTLTGTDSINGTGNALNNLLTGNSAANILSGGAGVDTMAGGTGDDTYVVDDAGDVVREVSGAGTDTVQSSVSYSLTTNVENLFLSGTGNINGIGNDLVNTINGNPGNNTIDGGVGADTMAGGAGDDIYVVDNASDVITEVSGAGTDTVQAFISYALTANVENLLLTGTSNINGTGNDLANTITGNAGNNTIDGGAEADNLAGGAGDDTYLVDNTSDVVSEEASEGTDTVQSSVTYTLGTNIENLFLMGTGNLNGIGNDLANTITGNAGNNTIDGGAGADNLAGGAGDDTYLVDITSDVVSEEASEGTDAVQSSVTYTLATNIENLLLTGTGNINGIGNDLANTINGNAGNNTIDGGAGADNMAGDAGNDIYVVDNAGDVVTEAASEGIDTVQSSIAFALNANFENLLLTGTGNINGTGNELANTITGNAGNNTIDGGAGADNMAGNVGNDIYVVDNAGDVVTEAFSAGTDIVQSSISYVLTANVENLTLTGTDNINGTGNVLSNLLTGNSGANILSGGAGDDTYLIDNTGDVVSEEASEGTDTVQSSVSYFLATNVESLVLTGADNINGAGNDLANTITGNAGNNTIDGGAGADNMAGNAGNDIYVVDDSGDVVKEASGAGTDTVQSSISYALTANVENLTLTGTGNINGTGNALNNILTGNSAANILSGGSGDDTYLVDNAGDFVLEAVSEGTDTVQSSVSYSLATNVESLVLTGADNINGTGNDLANTITGNAGNNNIDGGAGADNMAGGAGDDSYLVDNTSDVVLEAASEGTDTLQSSITYTLAKNVENLVLIGTGNINGIGNTLNNILTGNSGSNILRGGAGYDTYEIGNGDTVIENPDAGTDTVQSSATYTLFTTNVEDLILTGTSAINATGNALDNHITGNSAANIIIGGAGVDVLAGMGGADTFRYTALSNSRLAGFDRIIDLEIGTDILDGPRAVSAANTKKLGAVATLDQAGISAVLTTAFFGANQAGTFTFGSGSDTRTFLALNDATAGFSSTSDCLIEITGYTGELTKLAIS